MCWLSKNLQANRKTANSYITCCDNTDGIGAQIHAICSTIIFADVFGLTYVHTPISNVQHILNFGDQLKYWNNYLNFNNYKSINSLNLDTLNKKNVRKPVFFWKKSNTIYFVRNCHQFTDHHLVDYQVIRSLKKIYKPANLNRFENVLNIAIHVRRGDVSEDNINSSRYTPLNILNKLLKDIIKIASENRFDYLINLYSQGKENDFSGLGDIKVNYRLDENEFSTFKSLVESDILITAKSSFSYTAALFSDGIILYEPFWHPPMKNWISINSYKYSILSKKISDIILSKNL